MPNKFIDSHAHLTHSSSVESDLPQILSRARQAGLTHIVNICSDAKALSQGLTLAANEPWIFNASAPHPHDVEEEGESLFLIVEKYARKGDLIAVGETGLDYFYSYASHDMQKKYLIKCLHLALESKIPVIIHCRDAFNDFFEILDSEYVVDGYHAPGLLHCFTGTAQEAEQVIKRGWYLSLSGIVTFKKSLALQDIAKWVPLDRLLIETDSPYLAPQSHRGKTNEPSYLPETAAVIAALKGISVDEVAEATTLNAKKFFQISSEN
jgi:TatD DNase family protein